MSPALDAARPRPSGPGGPAETARRASRRRPAGRARGRCRCLRPRPCASPAHTASRREGAPAPAQLPHQPSAREKLKFARPDTGLRLPGAPARGAGKPPIRLERVRSGPEPVGYTACGRSRRGLRRPAQMGSV